MRRTDLEQHLAAGLSLESIGREVKRHPSTIAYWLRKHGLTPVHAARHAPKGEVPESSLRALVEEGLTVRQIAARLDRGTASVRHWLRVHGLRTSATVQRAAARRAVLDGERRITRACGRHGVTVFVHEGGSSWRCLQCRQERVADRRRQVKATLVGEAGGRCVLCGYDRCLRALEFHHRDPSTKEFGLGFAGVTRSLAAARKEARKCVLLCSNCHAEVEDGVSTLAPPALHSTAAHGPG
jgi:transposase